MTISVGAKLPDATLLKREEGKISPVSIADRLKGRKVVVFGLPGAFTDTCSTLHLPSFMRTSKAFAAKGVDEIICIAVNDPFVMKAWGESTGATAAGLTFLADSNSEFTKAVGMELNVPHLGFIDRLKRFSLYAEDGVVKVFNHGQETGACEISGGETLLAQI